MPSIKSYVVDIKENFIGRSLEWKKLAQIGDADLPQILIVYGRRRIGKTELIEQVYQKRSILKFEGIRDKPQAEQMAHVMWQLSEYTGNPLFAKVQVNTWVEVFKIIYEELPEGKWTLYFEEIQWLADYKVDFISELKFAWDNYFKRKKQLLLILCGSSPSFIVNQVILSKSLYNRSQHELHLQEFSLSETRAFLAKQSIREVMDAYLTVGGIPEYLQRLRQRSSVFTSLCEQSFLPDSFFSKEYERIFVSSLAENKHYKRIIEILALKRFSSRNEILKDLKITSSGSITELFQDLELCGFIEKYTPYNLGESSNLSRFCIADNYLQFYYKFIKPISSDIQRGSFSDNPVKAIKADTYQKWLGFAFERMCRRKHHLIAKILGFHAVRYRSGTFFSRSSQGELPGFQFDLVFDRDDKVLTLCEIKYLQGPVSSDVINEFERKIQFLPNQKRKTIHKVLISAEGIDSALEKRHYFDDVIKLEDFFR